MTRKSVQRFSEQVMRKTKERMIPTRRAALAQSGHRFSDQIMHKIKARTTRKSVKRFSEEVMRKIKKA